MFWRKKGNGAGLRLFFATDIHGSDQCFAKFLNAAKAYGAQVLIMGGDIAGKRVVPIVPNGDGGFVATLGAGDVHLRSEDEILGFEKQAANAGLYPFRGTKDDVAALGASKQAVEDAFLRLARERLERWLTLAEERLSGTGVRLFINCGNDDPLALDEMLRSSAIAVFPEGRVVEIDEKRVMASVGYANQTPWHCPRDVSEEELARRIADTLAQRPPNKELILNCHCPPYNSALDLAPKLTNDFTQVTEGGQQVLAPVGSTAVRTAIETHQPLLSLHGHIHDSRGVVRIGRTVAINPGSEYPEGILRGALVDLSDSGIKGYLLTSG